MTIDDRDGGASADGRHGGYQRAVVRAIVRRIAMAARTRAHNWPRLPHEDARSAATREERARLRRWLEAGTLPERFVARAQAVLLADEGLAPRTIARTLSIDVRTIGRWCRRYHADGLEGLLHDAAIALDERVHLREKNAMRVRALADTPIGRTRWTVRDLAMATGVSITSVGRILNARDAEPAER